MFFCFPPVFWLKLDECPQTCLLWTAIFLNASRRNTCNCRDGTPAYLPGYRLTVKEQQCTFQRFTNITAVHNRSLLCVEKNKSLTWWVGWVRCLSDAETGEKAMLRTGVNPQRRELEKELNITTRRTFLTDTAPVLLGCSSPLSTELCCHTVVHLFNYILKVTPAECAVTDIRHSERAGMFLLSGTLNTGQVRHITMVISLFLLVIYCMYTPLTSRSNGKHIEDLLPV